MFQTHICLLGQNISQGIIILIESFLEFASNFPNKILEKKQRQRFLESLNYVLDFCPNIQRIAKPFHDRLKKNPTPWSSIHTKAVQEIKYMVKEIHCLNIANPPTYKIIETNASDISYCKVLKQLHNKHKQIIQYASAH